MRQIRHCLLNKSLFQRQEAGDILLKYYVPFGYFHLVRYFQGPERRQFREVTPYRKSLLPAFAGRTKRIKKPGGF
jgi:hypothetical protein